MKLRASAPGKLVVLGEFVVLEGAPAVVVAVDRRARLTLEPLPEREWLIDAPALDVRAHALELTGHAVRHLGDPAREARLGVVAAALEAADALTRARGVRLTAHHLSTDTSALSLPSGEKLGLGASAALCTALIAGACATAGVTLSSDELLVAAVAAHRRAQGSGSGIDVAASTLGGALTFSLDRARVPKAKPVRLPPELRLKAVWSGASQSTPAVLRSLEAFRAREPQAHAAAYARLGAASRAGVEALERGDLDGFLGSVRAFAEGTDELGRASGVELVSEAHRALGAIVTSSGGVYKPSGAGGDLGLALCPGDDVGARVAAALASHGATTLEIAGPAPAVAVESLE